MNEVGLIVGFSITVSLIFCTTLAQSLKIAFAYRSKRPKWPKWKEDSKKNLTPNYFSE